jgi:hypothetical protein
VQILEFFWPRLGRFETFVDDPHQDARGIVGVDRLASVLRDASGVIMDLARSPLKKSGGLDLVDAVLEHPALELRTSAFYFRGLLCLLSAHKAGLYSIECEKARIAGLKAKFVTAYGPWRWLLNSLGCAAITMPWKRIYILSEHQFNESLRRHELVHIEQIDREGAIRFSVKYLWWLLIRGYWENPFEIEAYQKAPIYPTET